jgi:hypothetical protein
MHVKFVQSAATVMAAGGLVAMGLASAPAAPPAVTPWTWPPGARTC